MGSRPGWSEYFMQMALLVSTRATCPRLSVGSVIVKDCQVISSGYNGAPKGLQHCVDVGCLLESNHCTRAVHSELNALLQASKRGAAVDGAFIYTTHNPCRACFHSLVAAGISRIFYLNEYKMDQQLLEDAVRTGVKMMRIALP